MPLTFVLAVIIALAIPSARQTLLDLAGKYGYAGIFLVSFLGGISFFIPLPYPILIIPLVEAGLNPWLLALGAGIGATLGDGISYYLGRTAADAYPEKLKGFKHAAANIYNRYPWFAPLILFAWAALIPFPNEVFVVPFGITRYGIWKTLAIAVAGNMTFVFLIAKGASFLIN